MARSPRNTSPLVAKHEWGSIEVNGWGTFRDALLTPGQAVEWDWRETDTHHRPGVLPAVVDLLAVEGVKAVVLSQGVDGVLLVPASTVSYAESLGLEVHVARTPEAVEIYNSLATHGHVGAALHSTC